MRLARILKNICDSHKLLYGHLSSYGLLHELANGVGRIGVVTLEEHQFRDSTLDGHIAAADDASLLQMVAAVITTHLHSALQTLTDVDDDLAVVCTLLQGIQQPR